MKDPHITALDEDERKPGTAHTWGWACSCKQTRHGYPTRYRAELGAMLHRGVMALDSRLEGV